MAVADGTMLVTEKSGFSISNKNTVQTEVKNVLQYNRDQGGLLDNLDYVKNGWIYNLFLYGAKAKVGINL
jgi:hypothetical protein